MKAVSHAGPGQMSFVGTVLAAGLGCLLFSGAATAATNDTTSFWDKALLDMELQHVEMSAGSLFAAWDKLGRAFLVRSVLALRESSAVRRPFEFTKDACTVRDLIGALMEAYPDYQLSQDLETGILWIHPASVPYESLLATSVVIPPGMNQVPALQGVLRPLQSQGAFGIRWRGIVGAFENAHAFPVNLRPGVHTVRDVLNMCLQASPSRTFYVALNEPQAIVTPVDILNPPGHPEMDKFIRALQQGGSPGQQPASPGGVTNQALPFTAGPNVTPLRPGSLRFWRLGMGRAGDAQPSNAELLEALASQSAHERWVVRLFMGAEVFQVPIQRMVSEAPPGREAVWAALGMLTTHNLATPSSRSPGLLRIRREVSLDTAASLDRGTVVLAAMEMARVGDDALLKKVARWALGPDELATIDPDGVRIANSSSIVRTALKEANCAWPGLSANDLRATEERKLLVLHQ